MHRLLPLAVVAAALSVGCDAPPAELDVEEVAVEPPPRARALEDTAEEPPGAVAIRAPETEGPEISKHLLSPEQLAELEAEAEQIEAEPAPPPEPPRPIRIERPEPPPAAPAPVVQRRTPPRAEPPPAAPAPAVTRRAPPPAPVTEDDGLAEVELPDEPEPRSVFDGSCDPLDLEPHAVEGSLDEAQVSCLQDALDSATLAAEREALSLVLVTQARASGDEAAWEQAVVHHLTEVDPSNPALAYRYALHTFDKGPEHAEEAMAWTEAALAHRAAWTGETYRLRVEGLFKLRAATAQILWRQAVDAYQTDPVDWRKEEVEHARLLTLDAARDWYSFARATDQEVAMARRLCGLAGDEACGQGT